MSTKNIHEPKKKSARTSFRKTAAKPLQLLGPWCKSALLHHPLQQEKSPSQLLGISCQGSALVWRWTAKPGRAGWDGRDEKCVGMWDRARGPHLGNSAAGELNEASSPERPGLAPHLNGPKFGRSEINHTPPEIK